MKTKLSIRKLIFLIFIISLFISVTSYGIVIFANWMSSARKTAELIAADVNESIYNQVYLFMQAPNKVNEQSQKIIANGMLDLADEKQRDRFFVGALEAQRNEIFSFSYVRKLRMEK